MEIEFREFPKIPRGGANETVTVTEKIDGTNACVIIGEDGSLVGCQSRKRLIFPGDDNFGFASWAHDNRAELATLGEGYHYGEWAGPGIQKNPHGLETRKFFLFNTARWNSDNPNRPECCDVVPTLYEGPVYPELVSNVMQDLWESYVGRRKVEDSAVKPEGIICWYHRGRRYEKHTFENPEGKWMS